MKEEHREEPRPPATDPQERADNYEVTERGQGVVKGNLTLLADLACALDLLRYKLISISSTAIAL